MTATSLWLDDLKRIAEGRKRRKIRAPVVRMSPVLHELNFWKGQKYGYIVFTRPSARAGYWWGKCTRCKDKGEREYRLNRRMLLNTCGCLRQDSTGRPPGTASHRKKKSKKS